MNAFDATYARLQNIRTRMPEFPLELVRLIRMTYHIQKGMKDLTNATLKKYDLVDASYMVLAVLYGTEGESSNACTLGMACHEKPANLTRVCNDLEERGLIHRGSRPGDRRSVMISLSDRGRALIEEIMPQVCAKTTQAYDGFSAEELQQMERIFARQLRNLNNIT
ncbi:MarR family transcriptional regulator [Janthinobacterium fluminis]|uniref:HTH-type transcriptional regulator MgrA n=1 Tax=Janthinobacterium fluminis TaxID=2987524 RepID=A0ABT5JXV0_9BURK|nr:MarR family transcriptional regulator [Janthinobacterium fluminis]MDC8757563.1 MarR family transcriptional regulator [Janthinobacterium fluminis]